MGKLIDGDRAIAHWADDRYHEARSLEIRNAPDGLLHFGFNSIDFPSGVQKQCSCERSSLFEFAESGKPFIIHDADGGNAEFEPHDNVTFKVSYYNPDHQERDWRGWFKWDDLRDLVEELRKERP